MTLILSLTNTYYAVAFLASFFLRENHQVETLVLLLLNLFEYIAHQSADRQIQVISEAELMAFANGKSLVQFLLCSTFLTKSSHACGGALR